MDISVENLLYVCDRIQNKKHIIHITFLFKKTAGKLVKGNEPEESAYKIKSIKMVLIDQLTEYGFSAKFSKKWISKQGYI